MNQYILTYVTVPNQKEAEHISKLVLEKKLAACVNVLPKVQSHYFWQGKVCSSDELVLIIKTKESLFEQLRQCVVENHTYEVPCVLKIPCLGGHKPYLQWLASHLEKD